MVGIPARLRLLQDLAACAPGDKVRFLGCVQSYHAPSATVMLVSVAATAAVPVDVSVPLPTLPMGFLRDGMWVNVIGFVEKLPDASPPLRVRAITVWAAGDINLDDYERGVRGRMEHDLAG